ncbi:MAG: cyclase family protein [Promethearchaeota archaeon]
MASITGWATERITLSTHTGTHMDSPLHFASIQDKEKGQRRAMTIDEILILIPFLRSNRKRG